uniref:Uncharacterized protein n=1 Tax=Anopheles atroparvus TaxID=41427 RepID=A0A182IR60_ANOAO
MPRFAWVGREGDKSNSVAHLVENEMPLSSTGNVSACVVGGVEDTTTTTVLLDEDGMELEPTGYGSHRVADDSSNKQLTGSYTNLFRDSNGVNGSAGVTPGKQQQQQQQYHHTTGYGAGGLMMSDCDKIQSADEIINVSELMMVCSESTMIDTALDLDSLDGSIGNHSQSCLVKTAIV